MSLAVTDLACARGGLPVVEGVSFRMRNGAALVLRGPNGSGKTTLLRTVAGLQPPLSGRIEGPPEGVAYAGHQDGLKPTLTAAENLYLLGAAPRHRPGRRCPRARRLRDRRVGDAAGAKRLGGAEAAAGARAAPRHRAEGLGGLDEPTVSLDAAATALFGRVLATHLGQGGTALLATHIDLGLEAPVLDLAPFRARVPQAPDGFW